MENGSSGYTISIRLSMAYTAAVSFLSASVALSLDDACLKAVSLILPDIISFIRLAAFLSTFSPAFSSLTTSIFKARSSLPPFWITAVSNTAPYISASFSSRLFLSPPGPSLRASAIRAIFVARCLSAGIVHITEIKFVLNFSSFIQ